MSEWSVSLNGIDITAWTISMPRILLSKSYWGEVPHFPGSDILVRTSDNFLRSSHPASVFYNRDAGEMDIHLSSYNWFSWHGQISAFSERGGYEGIIGASPKLHSILHTPFHFHATEATPSQVAKIILEAYNITIDRGSFFYSDSLLKDASCKVFLSSDILEWPGTLSDIVHLLCVSCVGRIFSSRDSSIGFDVWNPFYEKYPSYALLDKDILSIISIEDIPIKSFHGYHITYLDGILEWGNQDNAKGILRLNFGSDSAVQMLDRDSALYCGDSWLAFSNTKKKRIKLKLEISWIYIISIGSFVHIDSRFVYGVGEVISVHISEIYNVEYEIELAY